jgi:pimeloyl-ACP methyl ester carboxylesterase
MSTLVLIHGAWLGGWVWSRVLPDLRARGHVVFAPTLTGLGERDHLLGPDIDLDLHATDVVNLLEYEDLQRVLLVGHGYGGAVAQRVAALAPERIGRLAFLDATLARDGASLHDALGPAADVLRTRAYDDDGVRVYAPDAGLLLDGLVKRDADWVEDRLTPMPVAPYDQQLDLAAFFALDRPVIAVRCTTGDPAAATGLAIAGAYGFPGHEIEGGHLVMLSKPEPTAELLDNFARQPAARFVRHEP